MAAGISGIPAQLPGLPPLADILRQQREAPRRPLPDFPEYPNDQHCGHGTQKILELTRLLESYDIPCCLVGVSALKYNGAPRIRQDWEICVPTASHQRVVELLKSEAHSATYLSVPAIPYPQVHSMSHLRDRFKGNGFDYYFVIVSDEAHMECTPENFERSLSGLPYPKLHIFAQSLLAMNAGNDLSDLVDGQDLTLEWGEENLDLSGTTDLDWAIARNEEIRARADEAWWPQNASYYPDGRRLKLRDLWERIVGDKQRRMGWKNPPELFVTQYKLRGWPDPRTMARDDC